MICCFLGKTILFTMNVLVVFWGENNMLHIEFSGFWVNHVFYNECAVFLGKPYFPQWSCGIFGKAMFSIISLLIFGEGHLFHNELRVFWGKQYFSQWMCCLFFSENIFVRNECGGFSGNQLFTMSVLLFLKTIFFTLTVLVLGKTIFFIINVLVFWKTIFSTMNVLVFWENPIFHNEWACSSGKP